MINNVIFYHKSVRDKIFAILLSNPFMFIGYYIYNLNIWIWKSNHFLIKVLFHLTKTIKQWGIFDVFLIFLWTKCFFSLTMSHAQPLLQPLVSCVSNAAHSYILLLSMCHRHHVLIFHIKLGIYIIFRV